MLRGFFLSSYTFSSAGEFRFAVWLTIGAFVAFVGELEFVWPQRAGR